MLLVFGLIALTIMVLSGFGAALSGDRQTSDRSFFDLAILGLLLVSAIGLVANFFVPLRLSLVLATGVVGIACFVLHRRLLWTSLGQRPLAMLAVPAESAQGVADQLVQAGVRGILNYAPINLSVPPEVHVQNIDPVENLQRITYYV